MILPHRALTRRVFALPLLVAALSIVAMWQSRALLEWTLPFQSIVIELLQPNFIALLSISDPAGVPKIRLEPFSIHTVQLGPRHLIAAQSRLSELSTHLDHTMVPFVLFLTGVLAWPFKSARELLTRLLVSLPLLVIMLALTAPVLLAGKLDMLLLDAGEYVGVSMEPSFLVHLTIFMEAGGRWLVPIVAAISCILWSASGTTGNAGIDSVP